MAIAYRQPGVKVTQEFLSLRPALQSFRLPNISIGPAFKVVSDQELGSYDGFAVDVVHYPYIDLASGSIVDTREADSEGTASGQYPVTITLNDALVVLIPEQSTGYVDAANLLEFKDATVDAFKDVLAGDSVVISSTAVEVIPPQTNGVTSDASRSFITAGILGQFVNVAVDDTVTITSGGAGVVPGIYTVIVTSPDVIEVDRPLFPAPTVGSGVPVNYSIGRDTVAAENSFLVRKVVDANTLQVTASLPGATTGAKYTINRTIPSVSLISGTDYAVDETGVALPPGLTYNGQDIVSGTVTADYRSLDVALSEKPFEVRNVIELANIFGLGQIVPSNPLAFAMSMALKNAVTPTNGLGLGADYYTDEVLAYQKALAKLEATEMYAITPLTNNPTVAGLTKTHVIGMSDPEMGLERVSLTARKLMSTETIADDIVTSGKRVIVNTQTNGVVASGAATLTSPTSVFMSVQSGDSVTITTGTGVVPGEYLVTMKDSDTSITLQNFTASAAGTDVVYFIERLDGLEANGTTFFDSNATFLSDEVTVGSLFEIKAPAPGVPSVPPIVSLEGKYKVESIISETELKISQVPGVISVQGKIPYAITRDMDKDEQADFLASYASSIGHRRVVVMWPDVLNVDTSGGITPVDGFFLGPAIGAMTTGFPPQQGFTNITVSGITSLEHSNEYFTRSQLNKIASGGVMILVQDVPEALPYIRHELTTDRSAVKFQEYMVTKNVDYIAKFMRASFSPFIGKYNIVDSTYDELKSVSGSIMDYLKTQTSIKGIGGIIKSGHLRAMDEGASIDTITMKFTLAIPIPLNNIDITIEV